jgi:hypothetical protein
LPVKRVWAVVRQVLAVENVEEKEEEGVLSFKIVVIVVEGKEAAGG